MSCDLNGHGETAAAVVDDLVRRYGRAPDVRLDPEEDVREALTRFARALMDTIHSPPIMALHRLAIGESGRFPELARMFFKRGQARGKALLAAFIAAAMARGTLRDGDPMTAARQLSGMLLNGSPQMHMLNLIATPDPVEVDAEIEASVDSFMRAWGP